MTTSKVAPDRYVALKEAGLNNQEIADKILEEDGIMVSEASVRRGLRAAQHRPFLIPGYAREQLDTVLEQPLRINVTKAGAGAITADWHHPLADYDLINSFLDHAVSIGATNWLVVAGDWFNIDALSAFDSKDDKRASMEQEFFGSNVAMERVLKVFKRVYLSWGNHDARVHKALGYKVSFARSMRMMFSDLDNKEVRKISLSNLDHVLIDTPNGPYRVVHPKTYNSSPLVTARKLASKELSNIITGHSHHTAIGHDVSGTFVCAEIGGFFDADKTQYLQRTTTYPKWQNGYGFIDSDGFLMIEGQGWSNRVQKKVT
jgi:UDP-2,3-diacylglucosamine pyrophosphatase LpxH